MIKFFFIKGWGGVPVGEGKVGGEAGGGQGKRGRGGVLV